ncbi:peptidyl-prolyl cis-trans isomerase-like [Venturia canescens]|uniref:peptidyl-prolyl cis-trans isomerase-like n=1 Tax=Venturia canescens TaxID=32260 RepID=UPI001C9CC3F7|nr:peptidyl-prolyl cis-trans isomerase-like [Venturia canescens]
MLARFVESNGLDPTADPTRQRKKSRVEKENNRHAQPSRIMEKISLSKPIEDRTRPICYFEIVIAVNYRKLGNLIFQLFDNVVPKTCQNFISFCRGFNGLSYQGTPFHRIVPGYWCQGGDVQKFNGSGETSIYGDTFEDESFELKHSERGILSTCGFEKDSNCSKFNLTFKPLESVDGKRVVFGKVIEGLATLKEIERYGSIAGKPTMKIIVSKCGVLENDELEN